MEPTGRQGHSRVPLIEHDPARQAFIEPAETISRRDVPRDVPRACVITFFGDVVDRLVERRGARVLVENRWEDGPHPLLEVGHSGERVAVLRSGVGAPLAGALLEEVIAMGCGSFVVCGGAGALRSEMTLGHFVVVSSAIRDEETSYHYLPPARSIQFDEAARRVLEDVLKARGAPFVVGQTWTTDAPYRENVRKDRAASSRRVPDRRDGGRCVGSGGEFSRGAPCPGRVLRRRSCRRLMGSPLLAEPLRRSR